MSDLTSDTAEATESAARFVRAAAIASLKAAARRSADFYRDVADELAELEDRGGGLTEATEILMGSPLGRRIVEDTIGGCSADVDEDPVDA